MTPRRPSADRLPTLTEVVEYEGEVIRLRSIAVLDGHAGVAEQPSALAPMVDAALATNEAQAASMPAEPAQAMPSAEAAIGELERRLADALDQRLGEAFSAIFERAAETARRECRELMLETVRDLRRQEPGGLDVDGIAARPADTR